MRFAAQRALGARVSAPMPAGGTTAKPSAEPISARLFVCARCHAEAVVCSVCDRGQRYCSSQCSAQARRESLLRAGRRYQSRPLGRLAHARRARAYRQRRAQPPPPPRPALPAPPSSPAKIVTHQGSQALDGGDVLAVKLDVAQITGCEEPAQWRCCWCSRTGQSQARRGFLRHGRALQHVAYWNPRGTPHGPSP
jgi:hypothetical protein